LCLYLKLNNLQIGALIDETGCTGPGKLILSPKAWEQLLGRSPKELVALNVDTLKYLEQRLLFLRVTMLFGWTAEDTDAGIGRLCIGEVQM
jgi:hypothetical protein